MLPLLPEKETHRAIASERAIRHVDRRPEAYKFEEKL